MDRRDSRRTSTDQGGSRASGTESWSEDMTKANRNQERDAVLFSFHEAFERPTAAQIIEWTERYPEFADDIRAHAAIAREWADAKGVMPAEADESLLAAGYSRALDLMHKASKSR